MRVAIMGGITLFAWQVGRRQGGANTLAISALIMALVSPLVLWDVGFQLSFVATLGLILYGECFTQAFKILASRWLSTSWIDLPAAPDSEYLLSALAAQVLTLPLGQLVASLLA